MSKKETRPRFFVKQDLVSFLLCYIPKWFLLHLHVFWLLPIVPKKLIQKIDTITPQDWRKNINGLFMLSKEGTIAVVECPTPKTKRICTNTTRRMAAAWLLYKSGPTWYRMRMMKRACGRRKAPIQTGHILIGMPQEIWCMNSGIIRVI